MTQPISERGYSDPDAVVSTYWLEEHRHSRSVRVVEANEDVRLYDSGHIPGAVNVDWNVDLNDALIRDYVDADGFAALMGRLGIERDTTVVFYGDKFNWWATYAFWAFKLFGHPDCRVMDGGRAKWEAEGHEMTIDVPAYDRTDYPKPARDDASIRAFREDVMAFYPSGQLIDVRSPEEYRGELLQLPDYPQEGSLRGGHIPGARSVPWARAVEPDTHTFKSADELRLIYEEEQGLDPAREVITYCRIGERSSHTWFVLSYLLGYENVRNYDGSWTEWGNVVRAPIER